MGGPTGPGSHAELGRVSRCLKGEKKRNTENRANTTNQDQEGRDVAFSRISED